MAFGLRGRRRRRGIKEQSNGAVEGAKEAGKIKSQS